MHSADAKDTSQRLVDVFEQLLLRRAENDLFDVHGRPLVESLMLKFVETNSVIEFVLPAFPFKSPSRKKVLGSLPDYGEYFSLYVLNSLCETLKSLYPPGACVRLVSDGSVYHDLVGVSEEDFIAYDDEVRRMGREFPHLKFHGVRDLLSDAEYEKWSTNKQGFIEDDLNGFDLASELKTNDNLLQVYRGYLIFMQDDLEGQLEKMTVSNTQKRKYVSSIAKQLVIRGQVYSELVRRSFPDSIRLSIHGHNNCGPKIAVAICSELQCKTPWHNCAVLRQNGRLELMKVCDVPKDAKLITKHGRPWMMVEEHADLLQWDIEGEVQWELLLPFGLLLVFPQNTPLHTIPQQQLRRLALKFGALVVRGVEAIPSQAVFEHNSSGYGTPQGWFFGNVLTVKVDPARAINNVLSKEAMPMHYDGLFKLDERGKPMAPAFQYFYCKHAAGTTLFSDTRQFAELFPSLVDKKWKVFTPKNESFGGTPIVLDLFEKHPLTNEMTLRFHEPWGQEKTVFKPTHVEIVADNSENWCRRLVDCLYNRRFCLHHQWRVNDVVIADNLRLMHTRLDYEDTERELWRIHYN